MNLPVHQVRQGQRRPAELCIQPDAEVMQGDLCGQACLKPAECMRPLSVEAEGMRELLMYVITGVRYALQASPPRFFAAVPSLLCSREAHAARGGRLVRDLCGLPPVALPEGRGLPAEDG